MLFFRATKEDEKNDMLDSSSWKTKTFSGSTGSHGTLLMLNARWCALYGMRENEWVSLIKTDSKDLLSFQTGCVPEAAAELGLRPPSTFITMDGFEPDLSQTRARHPVSWDELEHMMHTTTAEGTFAALKKQIIAKHKRASKNVHILVFDSSEEWHILFHFRPAQLQEDMDLLNTTLNQHQIAQTRMG